MKSQPPHRLLLILIALLLSIILARAQVAFDPFPVWSGDPTLSTAPVISLTPGPAAILNVLTCGLCTLICLLLPPTARPPAWQSLALLVGSGAATSRMLVDRHATLDDTMIGTAWTSAMAGAVTINAASAIPAIRRLAFATLFAAIAAVAAKALVQVMVEFPASVRMFQQTKARFLESQGWSPESPMAKAFERRMTQTDASAWFGISNILATFGAVVSVTLAGLLATSWRSLLNPARAMLGAGVACALLALLLTKSKGGAVATALGGLILVLGLILPGAFQRVSKVLGAGVVAAVLLGILARGMLGERISELSLLFRSFYIEAAMRIFATHPLGVGPGSFKEAYLLLKNPMSPEDVSSPHSILFDWLATLGIFGVAWIAVWGSWVHRGCAQQTPDVAEDQSEASTDHTALLRPAFLILAAPALLGAFIEREAGTPESLLVRLISILLGAGVAWGVLAVPQLSRIALAAGTCVIAAHAQIELTPSHVGACAWLFALLAVLAPVRIHSFIPAKARKGACFAAFSLITLLALLPVRSTMAWERELRAAGAFVAPLPDLQARRDAMAAGRPLPGDTPAALIRDLGTVLGPHFRASELPREGQRVDATLSAARADLLMRAREHLEAAHHHAPSHYGTLHALSQLVLQLASLTSPSSPLPPDAGLESLLVPYAERYQSTSAWTWIALMRQSYADRPPTGPGSVVDAWERAISLAPWEPMYHLKAALAARDAGAADVSRSHAQAALKLNENMRLDPLKQFAAKDLKVLEGMASGE